MDISEAPVQADTRYSVDLRVTFDDLTVPDIIVRVWGSTTGHLGEAAHVRSLATLAQGHVSARVLFTRFDLKRLQHADLVRMIVEQASRHRLEALSALPHAEDHAALPPAADWTLVPPVVLSPPNALDFHDTPENPSSDKARYEFRLCDPEDSENDREGEDPPQPLFPDLDLSTMADKTEIQLYDLAALKRELAIRPPGDTSRNGPSHMAMLDRLHKLGTDGARRWLEHARPSMIAAIEALGQRAPHFAPMTDLVLAHARASLNTGIAMRLPPVLIVDGPGTGKTWYLTRLAQALGVPFATVSMAAVTTGDTIQGSHPGWRNSAQGIVSKILIGEPIANPFIFVDEFDKPTGENGVQGSLYRPYYAALERENARLFTDEFLGLAMDASHVQWTLAANDIDRIPGPIRDRVTQVKIAPMTVEHRRVVARSIYETCNVAWKGWFEPDLSAAALAILEGQTPRRMRKALDLALVQAGAADRKALSPADIQAGLSQAIAESVTKAYGFVAGR